ncbi:MAG: hypothetical protein AAGB51_06910 [Planctomycetota bacterium]
MPKQPVVVLKFGGSVLLGEESLHLAVREIGVWRDSGYRVVAVVSALSGRTDQLEATCERVAPEATGHAKAALLGIGEAETAALLGLQLLGAGIHAGMLTPGSARFIARGDPLDADPLGIDRAVLEATLDLEGVVVFPGYTAIDELGRPVTLGRGGSDASALYIAYALDAARCRLIKDVDGLYTGDPAKSVPPPARYRVCSFDDALRTDGSIIQHKAVRLAKRYGVEFELGDLGSTEPTRIENSSSDVERVLGSAG